jgi:acyl-CoA synthetase (AMP-forming)/AMP-acid ligase II
MDWTLMPQSLAIPQYTLDDYEQRFAERHRLHDVVKKWSRERGAKTALIGAETGRQISWAQFERATRALAAELLRLGFRKGDFLLTLLPMTVEHVLLEYACFRVGVIVAPLDLRLSPAEVVRAARILSPRGLVAMAAAPPFDLPAIWRAVFAEAPPIEHCYAEGPAGSIEGALPLDTLLAAAMRGFDPAFELTEEDRAALDRADAAITPDDGALVIFTTGSTGSPKPALLSHRNITAQNLCLCGAFFAGDSGRSALVNLPPSHVGAQTEILMSVLFGGGTAVLLAAYDAARSLRAVAEHKVEILGQIPAMFNLEWMLKDYAGYDLSSLAFAAYGGNAVSRPFVEKLATMAPLVGTGLGLTEAAGFCTYVLADAADHELILAGLGQDCAMYPCTIREPMRAAGAAGEELAPGQVGHVCFRGPQTFLGYVGDAQATRRAVSTDGYLYTGDLGFRDASGLHLTGREKWVIKSAGYQIFPGDVETHVALLADRVANCVVVGVDHHVVTEAPVALVEMRPGAQIAASELDRHARALPSYMRPRHWIVLGPGQLPLNRVAKPDYLRAQQMAREAVSALRAEGGWDAAHKKKAARRKK